MSSSKLLSLLALVAMLATAMGASWQTSGMLKVTTSLAVATVENNKVYAAVMDNNVGVGYEISNDNGDSATFHGQVGGMNMAIATDKKGEKIYLGSAGALFYGDAGSTEFTKVTSVRGITQNARTVGDDVGIAFTGLFMNSDRSQSNGAAITFDQGATWTTVDTGLDSGPFGARYGAYPSADHFIITSGIWPTESATLDKNTELTSRLHVNEKGLHSFREPVTKNLRSTTYQGAISTTFDGGKTFATTFQTAEFYFNQVSCTPCGEICTAVGESATDGYVVNSVDGGLTWTQVAHIPNMSLVSVAQLNHQEAWIGGGFQKGRSMVGAFFHTTDGFATLEQVEGDGGYAFDIAFDKETGYGYSAGVYSQYSTIAVYK